MCDNCQTRNVYDVDSLFAAASDEETDPLGCNCCDERISIEIFFDVIRHARLLCMDLGGYIGTGECDTCDVKNFDFFTFDLHEKINRCLKLAYTYVSCPGCGIEINSKMLWNKADFAD